MKKSNNEVNHDRFVEDGKERKLKSEKSQRHNHKQNLREFLGSNEDDYWDDNPEFYG